MTRELLCLLLTTSTLSVNAHLDQQTITIQQDSVRAYSYFEEGDSLKRISEFDKAAVQLSRSVKLFQKHALKFAYLKSKRTLAEVYWLNGQLKMADSLANEVDQESSRWFGEESIEKGLACFHRGVIAMLMSDFDQSLGYLIRSKDILESAFEDGHQDLSRVYYILGQVYSALGDFDKAILHAKKDLAYLLDSTGPHDVNVSNAYQSISRIFYNVLHLDSAISYAEKAKLLIEASGMEGTGLATVYNNLGAYQIHKGNLDLALGYIEKAGSLNLRIYGQESRQAIDYYNNLAVVYSSKGDLQSVMINLEKSLNLALKVFGEEHEKTEIAYYNLAVTYHDLKEYRKAINTIKKTLALQKVLYGQEHLYVAGSYKSLALAYLELGDYDKAKNSIAKTLGIQETLSEGNEGRNSMFVHTYLVLSEIFNRAGEPDSALIYNKMSLYHNADPFVDASIDAFDPVKLDAFDHDYYNAALYYRADLLLEKFEGTGDIDHLKNALRTYEHGAEMLEYIRQARPRSSDKLNNGGSLLDMLEGAILSCLKLYEITKDDTYLVRAFQFPGRNRASLIHQNTKSLAAASFAEIPEFLLNREDSLLNEISMVRTALLNQHDSRETELKDRLFDLNSVYERLVSDLESEYPKYAHLKYRVTKFELKEVQRNLKQDELLIEYFQGDSSLVVFGVGRNDHVIIRIEGLFDIQESIYALKRVFDFPAQLYTTSSQETYLTNAKILYHKLLRPVLDSLRSDETQHLIIIPDGDLSYLPLNVLLTDEVLSFKGYKELPYLLKHYSIRSAYSTGFMNRQSRRAPLKNHVFAMASSYANLDSIEREQIGKFRDQMEELKWNQGEAKTIANNFGGTFMVGDNATEGVFKKNAKEYQIVHLAMHALIDDEEPMNSKLVFTPKADTLEDGYLHAFELYNMQLNTELMVLSACNTRVGQFERGEGMMSLSYAFAYAGVSSLLASGWQVDDRSTSELMQYFYTELANGSDKAQALRNAQLKFLESAPAAKSHPFYWAGFSLIGDPGPLSEKQSYTWHYVIALLIGLPLLLFLISKRRRAR